MGAASEEIFRLPLGSAVVVVNALAFLVLAALAWPHLVVVVSFLLQAIFFTALVAAVSVVSVGDDGLVLYRLWRLPWSQVAGARRISFFGLPYLLVARRKGFGWWVPLYFRGARPIEAALAARAPTGNPLSGIGENRK